MSSPPGTRDGRGRLAWVDNLRVAAIAGVIVVHTATAYVTDVSDWYYDDELRSTTVGFAVFAVPALLGGVFGLGPLFWLAGWFSAGSLRRRGPARFALDRVVRLGVPVLVFVLLVNPLADLVGNLRQEDRTFVDCLGESEFAITWFVLALIACSIGYAVVRTVAPARDGEPPGAAAFVVAAAAITGSAVLLWPVSSLLDEHLMSARPGAWPQGVVLFALGVLAAEASGGGVDPVVTPERRDARRWGVTAVLGALAVIVLMASSDPDALTDLLHEMGWWGIAFATAYGIVSVAFTLWCLSWFRRRWTGERAWSRAAGRASYATYLIHPLALTGLMAGLWWLPVVPEVKLVIVSVLGVPLCFAVGHLLTTLPGLRRILSS